MKPLMKKKNSKREDRRELTACEKGVENGRLWERGRVIIWKKEMKLEERRWRRRKRGNTFACVSE